MDREIELKLVVPDDAREIIESQFLTTLSTPYTGTASRLSNSYYDTTEHIFQRHRMGFRVRGVDGSYEQTLKTAGSVVGGVHQRPEYNQPLSSSKPDFSALVETFPEVLTQSSTWPEQLSAESVQAQLQCIFTTHFNRHAYWLEWQGSKVEMALDIGLIEAKGEQQPIHEVELELKQGPTDALFDIADKLTGLFPLRLSNLSKAARGYQLANDQQLKVNPLPGFLAIAVDDNTETAFCKALEFGLQHWLHHQEVYLQNHSPKALQYMLEGMAIMLQAVSLYLPVLQCPALLALHKSLFALSSQWQWLNQLNSLGVLRSKKGPFSKRLSKQPELLGYLHGRSEGMIQHFQPEQMILQGQYASCQIQAVALLHQKPWQQTIEAGNTPVLEHARGWLSQGWQAALQVLSPPQQLTADQYVSVESVLKQTLTNGFLLSALFAQGRDQYRAPWLDVLYGIEEIRALQLLQSGLQQSDIADKAQLSAWSEDKMQTLLDVMEQSRQAGIQGEAYW